MDLSNILSKTGDVLTDVSAGFNDNYNNGFNANNLIPQGQSIANRVGEGLGTLGRISDSPLARGLMAYALNEALGYKNSLKEGLTAFAGRQNQQNQNNIYKKQLQSMGVDTTGLNDIDNNTYKVVTDNIVKNQNLKVKQELAMAKDNTQRAKMITDAVNKGMMTPAEGESMLKLYGWDTKLQESNETQKTDAYIKSIDERIRQNDEKIKYLYAKLEVDKTNTAIKQQLANYVGENTRLKELRTYADVNALNAYSSQFGGNTTQTIPTQSSGLKLVGVRNK